MFLDIFIIWLVGTVLVIIILEISFLIGICIAIFRGNGVKACVKLGYQYEPKFLLFRFGWYMIWPLWFIVGAVAKGNVGFDDET